MSNPNFASVLDAPADEIKRPPLPPQGTYIAVVNGPATPREVGQNKTPAWDFNLKLLQPIQVDGDPEAIQKAIGRSVRATFFETEDAAWRLIRFLKDHLKIPSEGKTGRQMISEAAGRQCVVTVVHRPSQDGTEMFANIDNTAAV
jgi:hypothetical protein